MKIISVYPCLGKTTIANSNFRFRKYLFVERRNE